MTETSELDVLEELGRRIEQLIGRVDRYNIPRTNFSSILEDEKLLAIYHKEFGKVAKPLAYVKNLRVQFAKWHQTNPQLAIEEMKKRLQILVNLINVFSPSEVIRLRKIVLALDRTEIDEIYKCMADLQRWPTYALRNREQPYRIDFFFNRLVVYVKGGFLDGVQFLGLFSYFRDSELTKELLSNEAVKRLRMYKEQIEFFRMAEAIVLEALKPKGKQELFWGTQDKDFKDGFYYNLRAGKKYIDRVRYRFENEGFAKFLETLDETIHAYPEKWEERLIMLSQELHNPEYQNTHVIVPAIQALLALFQRTIDRISRSEVGFKEIDDILGKLEKEIERRKKRLLREDIGRLRKEFDAIDNPVADEMAVVMPALINYTTQLRMLPEQRLTSIFRTLGISRIWLRRYGIDVQRFLTKGNVPVGVLFFNANNIDKLGIATVNQINVPLFNQPFISYVDVLETRINTNLIPKLGKVVEFIKKYDNQFTIPISKTIELLPEVQGLLSKIQDKLIAELKEEGIDVTKPLYG